MKLGNGKDQSLSPGGEFIKKVGITKKIDSTIQIGTQDLVPQVVSPKVVILTHSAKLRARSIEGSVPRCK